MRYAACIGALNLAYSKRLDRKVSPVSHYLLMRVSDRDLVAEGDEQE